MAQRLPTLTTVNNVAAAASKWQNIRKRTDTVSSLSQEEQRTQNYLERQRLLSPKVERCLQELVERTYKFNSTFNFELLAPPPSADLTMYFINDNKEFYFDFYLVWKNSGKIKIERDESSVCCKVKYLDKVTRWSRAEQARLLISNVDKRKSCYLNGRGMRDLFFEVLHNISPDLIYLDFCEHLIYFDLIIPLQLEKTTCHITLLPCIRLPEENEVLLPFGTLRWYPRSLCCSKENPLLTSLQQPLQNITFRRFMSTNDVVDDFSKATKQEQQAFARARTIIHELLLACTSEHVDTLAQLQIPFDGDENDIKRILFIPHRTDRNCNIFPAGQFLLDDLKSRQFFREFIRTNIKGFREADQTSNNNSEIVN